MGRNEGIMIPDLGRRRFIRDVGIGTVALSVGACEGPLGQPQLPEGDADSDTWPDGDLDGGVPDGDVDRPDGNPAAELSPITPNDDFFITSSSGSPSVDSETWSLTIDGAVDQVAVLTMPDLLGLGAVEKEQTLCCIGSSPSFPGISNAVWEGRPLVEVLDWLGVHPTGEAVELRFECADGYRTSIPASDLEDRELFLAWRMGGAPLPAAHGAPVRLLTPDRYGMKNPKWITRLSLGAEVTLGTWESRGWSNDATYRPVVLFHLPAVNADLVPGVVPTAGSAFAGQTRVTLVEVSSDEGESWSPATITYQGPPGAWTLWSFDWTPPGPGRYRLLARIECEDGRRTTPDDTSYLAGFSGYGSLYATIR